MVTAKQVLLAACETQVGEIEKTRRVLRTPILVKLGPGSGGYDLAHQSAGENAMSFILEH